MTDFNPKFAPATLKTTTHTHTPALLRGCWFRPLSPGRPSAAECPSSASAPAWTRNGLPPPLSPPPPGQRPRVQLHLQEGVTVTAVCDNDQHGEPTHARRNVCEEKVCGEQSDYIGDVAFDQRNNNRACVREVGREEWSTGQSGGRTQRGR